jgi:hypothetical protein
MSHFSILVIGGNSPEFIEKQLYPYWELDLSREEKIADPRSVFSIEVPKDKIKETADEWMEKYKTKKTESDITEYITLYREGNYSELVQKWNGLSENSNGDLGYYHNPNAKWDWYTVGGRWNEFLRTKDGRAVNSAPIGDLDFAPQAEDINYATRFWEVVIENAPKTKEEENKYFSMYKPEYYVERYGTKENFIKLQTMFSTWGVIMPDGKWFEKGSMGWWGLSDESHDEANDWILNFYDRFLKDLTPDTVVTIVDCHI